MKPSLAILLLLGFGFGLLPAEQESLPDRIKRLNSSGEWKKAEEVARANLEKVQAADPKTEGLAAAVMLVVDCVYVQDRFDEAVELLEKHLALAKESGKGVANSHRALATVFGKQRKFEKARAHGEKALELLPEDVDPKERISVHRAFVLFETQSLEIERADGHFRKMIELKEALPEESQMELVRHYADYLRSAGRIDDSVKLLEEILEEREDLGKDAAWAVLNVQLASSILETDLARAKKVIDEALAVLSRHAAPKSVAMWRAWTVKGGVHGAMLSFRESEEAYREAVESLEGVEPPSANLTLTARQSWAMSLHRINRHEEAEREYRKVVELTDKHHGRGDTYCRAAANLATLLLHDRNPRPDEAIELLETALPYHRGVGALPGSLAHNLKTIIHACSGSGEYERAQPFAKELDELLAKRGKEITPYMRDICYFALVKQALHVENWRDSRRLARLKEEAVRDRAREMMSFAPASQRLAFQREVRPFDMLASNGEYGPLADAILRYKKLMLSSMMEEKQLHAASGNRDAEPLQERLVLAQAKFREGEFLGRPAGELKALSLEIKDLQEKLTGMLKVENLLGALDVTAKEVSDALPDDTALIEFLAYYHWKSKEHFSTHAFGAMVYQKGKKPKYQDLGASKNQKDWIWTYDRRIRKGTPEQIEDRCHRIHDYIWQPVAKHLDPRIKRVVICPDNLFANISFATLLHPDGSFLGEKYDFEYVSTGRDLLREPLAEPNKRAVIVGNPDFRSGVAAVGGTRRAAPPELTEVAQRSDLEAWFPPLPGAEHEARQLKGIIGGWGWETELLTAEDPTEALVRGLKPPGILHLATHGFYIEKDTKRETMGIFDNPMYRSGLALVGADRTFRDWRAGTMPAPGGDGVLMADEVTALDLDGTWLAVLSACDTGRGYFYNSEGKFGLPRAFMQAGVENLLTSLWPIPDEESAVFMEQFYKRLHECGDPGRALAETQRERMKILRAEFGVGRAVRMVGGFTMRTAAGIR